MMDVANVFLYTHKNTVICTTMSMDMYMIHLLIGLIIPYTGMLMAKISMRVTN